MGFMRWGSEMGHGRWDTRYGVLEIGYRDGVQETRFKRHGMGDRVREMRCRRQVQEIGYSR